MNIIKTLTERLGEKRVKENFNLSNYLTLRTNTSAKYYFEALTGDDLIKAKKVSLQLKIPIFILGGGSNLVVTKNIQALLVHNRYIEKKKINENDRSIILQVSSGYPMTLLAKQTASEGWEGLEYHFGLPGTVGGAVYMNSKWTKPLSYTGDSLVSADLIDSKGSVKRVDRDYFRFAYDYSLLQETHEIVLNAVFELKRNQAMKLIKRAERALAYRKMTQPFGVFSSGCFFRNISVKKQKKLRLATSSAGYLIDRAGLKGKRLGNFCVSPIHANFIINKGNGNHKDLLRLIKIIKDSVYQKFGLRLEEEVIVI